MARNWWETGKGEDYNVYAGKVSAIEDAFKRGEINEAKRNALKEQAAEKQFGADDFDIDRFDTLLQRLEGSKGRQQRQKSVEGRRDIFAQGLASMMSNF
jgi:hypothetical protein